MRERSLRLARELGYEVDAGLPLLDETVARTEEQVQTRALALHATVACAFGFDRSRACEWLEANDLWPHLSPSERALIQQRDDGPVEAAQARVEALHAFAWALSLADELDFSRPCPDDTVTLYPDLRRSEDASGFRRRARLRSAGEIVETADLAYCLHWAVRQAQVDGRPPPGHVAPHVVEERRRALDWILGEEDWDALTLDT